MSIKRRNKSKRMLGTIACVIVGATLFRYGLGFAAAPKRRAVVVQKKKPRHHGVVQASYCPANSSGNHVENYKLNKALKIRHDIANICADPLQSYLHALEKHPLVTKGITAATVNSLGDVLAQYLEATASHLPFQLDWLRLQVFFLCGLLYVGPYVHFWIEHLERLGTWMEHKFQSSKTVQTLAKVVVDQTIGVVIATPIYFYVHEIIHALVHGRVPAMSVATASIMNNMGSILLTNYYVWPAVNWISFTFVPVQLRVLLNNIVGVLWNAFMCTKMAG